MKRFEIIGNVSSLSFVSCWRQATADFDGLDLSHAPCVNIWDVVVQLN